MLMGMILTSPLAFGSSEIYQCSGVVKSYSTDDQQSIRLVMDTSKMIITILGDDGIPSSYAITSSQRSRSYMIGTQFIEDRKSTRLNSSH